MSKGDADGITVTNYSEGGGVWPSKLGHFACDKRVVGFNLRVSRVMSLLNPSARCKFSHPAFSLEE